MLRKRFLSFTCLMLFVIFNTLAQDIETAPFESVPDEPKPTLKERVYFGGNLGAQFGNYTMINVAPLVGFKINQKWSVGSQITYSYIKINNLSFQDHIYGGSLFTRYFIFKNFFAHTEYEALNGNWKGTGERFNVNSLFVGGGYLYKFSNRAGLGISAIFNVLPSTYSPYRNPIINAGFTFGL